MPTILSFIKCKASNVHYMIILCIYELWNLFFARLGDTLYEKQDYVEAVQSYIDALNVAQKIHKEKAYQNDLKATFPVHNTGVMF